MWVGVDVDIDRAGDEFACAPRPVCMRDLPEPYGEAVSEVVERVGFKPVRECEHNTCGGLSVVVGPMVAPLDDS